MRLIALCPTYRRPRLVENLLACFLAQTHADKYLIVGDDSGDIAEQDGENWRVLAMPRQPTLPAKYNAMAKLAIGQYRAEALVVMEDDDVYGPRYLANHAAALATAPWSHLSHVWTDGTGGGLRAGLYLEETGHARLHGCLAMRRETYWALGGWPETRRPDFDLQILAGLRKTFGRPGNPCDFGPPQYVFRWATSQEHHAEAFASDPGDEDWLAKAQAAIDGSRGGFRPAGLLTPRPDRWASHALGRLTPHDGHRQQSPPPPAQSPDPAQAPHH
jgi:glycosyltransferase involved in cell wall biosynthesis